jgi:hypothetical protein
MAISGTTLLIAAVVAAAAAGTGAYLSSEATAKANRQAALVDARHAAAGR